MYDLAASGSTSDRRSFHMRKSQLETLERRRFPQGFFWCIIGSPFGPDVAFLSRFEEATIPLIVPTPPGTGGAWPVQIGTLWHSAWELENILRKFCKQIFALTDHVEFPYSLVGSGTAVKMAGRHFLFCCRHQIRDYTPDKIAIPLSFDKKIMSASSMRELVITDANCDEDAIDVAAFDTTLRIAVSQFDERVSSR